MIAMGNIGEIINMILPWILLLFLLYFTLVLISYGIGLIRARKKDNSIRLALNTLGKVFFGALLVLYLIILLNTIRLEILIWSQPGELETKIQAALQVPNLLTVLTLLFATETQDIFFIGKKNVLIGNSMFEFRRMKRIQYPKKHKISFIYGQKQYTYSIRFVDISQLKMKITK